MLRENRARIRTALSVAAQLLAVAVAAAGAQVPQRAGDPAATGATMILGSVWKADDTPLPRAHLRLRNVRTGRVQAAAVANAEGRFTFASVETGKYVVELVSQEEKVLALGEVFSLEPGETVVTVVRLGSRTPWVSGFFSNAAAAAVAAASGLGVTALGSDGQPVSAAPASAR